jgi:hypothetical protein
MLFEKLLMFIPGILWIPLIKSVGKMQCSINAIVGGACINDCSYKFKYLKSVFVGI